MTQSPPLDSVHQSDRDVKQVTGDVLCALAANNTDNDQTSTYRGHRTSLLQLRDPLGFWTKETCCP